MPASRSSQGSTGAGRSVRAAVFRAGASFNGNEAKGHGTDGQEAPAVLNTLMEVTRAADRLKGHRAIQRVEDGVNHLTSATA